MGVGAGDVITWPLNVSLSISLTPESLLVRGNSIFSLHRVYTCPSHLRESTEDRERCRMLRVTSILRKSSVRRKISFPIRFSVQYTEASSPLIFFYNERRSPQWERSPRTYPKVPGAALVELIRDESPSNSQKDLLSVAPYW